MNVYRYSFVLKPNCIPLKITVKLRRKKAF